MAYSDGVRAAAAVLGVKLANQTLRSLAAGPTAVDGAMPLQEPLQSRPRAPVSPEGRPRPFPQPAPVSPEGRPRPVAQPAPSGSRPYSYGLDMIDDVGLANLARTIARRNQGDHGLRVGRRDFTDGAQASNFLRRNPRFMEAARQQYAKQHPALVIKG